MGEEEDGCVSQIYTTIPTNTVSVLGHGPLSDREGPHTIRLVRVGGSRSKRCGVSRRVSLLERAVRGLDPVRKRRCPVRGARCLVRRRESPGSKARREERSGAGTNGGEAFREAEGPRRRGV